MTATCPQADHKHRAYATFLQLHREPSPTSFGHGSQTAPSSQNKLCAFSLEQESFPKSLHELPIRITLASTTSDAGVVQLQLWHINENIKKPKGEYPRILCGRLLFNKSTSQGDIMFFFLSMSFPVCFMFQFSR